MSESSPRWNRRSRITYIVLNSCSQAVLTSLITSLTAVRRLRTAHGTAGAGAPVRSSITRQTSLSSWFSFQMPYAVPSSTGGTATSRIAPLVAPKTDAQLPLPGGEDHGQRVGHPQHGAPQALLARLHHGTVPAGAEDLCLELLRAKVVGQRPGEFIRRDGGAVDPLDVQGRPSAGPRVFALLCVHFCFLRSRRFRRFSRWREVAEA